MIASSPTDIQPVLDVIAANAADCATQMMRKSIALKRTLCGKWPIMGLSLLRGRRRNRPLAVHRERRAIVDRQTVHIP